MRTKIITNISLFLILFLGLIFFWIPEYKKLQNIQFELNQKKLDLANKELYFSKLREIEGKLADYSEEIDKINSALPDHSDVIGVINYLVKNSSLNGLTWTNVGLDKIGVGSKDTKTKKTMFNMSFSGSYNNFKKFLYLIEKSARLIDLSSLSFSPAPSSNSGDLEFKLKFLINSY